MTVIQSLFSQTPGPPVPVWDHAKTVSETIKAWAEAFGFAAAGLFFLYKAFSGYMISNLTLDISCNRKPSGEPGIDYLVVSAVIKKEDRGALTLHDVEAKISSPAPNKDARKKLSGIIRLSFKESGGLLEIRDKQSEKNPLLNLSPGEATRFSTYFEVLSERPCMVEITLLGGWRWHRKTAYQWQASQVSLPLSKKDVAEYRGQP